MQFAKLFLAALVFALGVVACSGGGSSSSGGGGDSAGIVPTTFDLSVTTFSVSSSSIVAGDAITFAATVTNDSSANVSSSVAALKYYRSTDTTIDSTADTEVGTADSISALAAAATESKTAIVNPSTAGTFYYGACVVATDDRDTSNDCSTGVQVDVAAQDFDLSVTAFSVSPSSIVAGDAITFAATVTNDSSATVSSSVATLKYYRSTDATIDSTADTEVGTADSISALAAAATESKTAIVNPRIAGTFYYFACVVSTGDSDTSNDCSAGVQVDVAAQDFDLSVTAFSVAPSSIVAGDAITFSATVTNDASATVSSSVAALKYYRSTDATIDSTADTEVGTADSIGALAAAATESKTAIVNPSTAGTFYYGACIVSTGDSDTSNDCSAGMQVDVAAQDFDLSVTASVSTSFALVGQSITLTATVDTASSRLSDSGVSLVYFRSSDATIDGDDTAVGNVVISAGSARLEPEMTFSESMSVSVPSSAGTYYYGACVYAQTTTCSAGVQVDVAAREFDLSVTTFSVSDSSVVTNERITLRTTVGNDSSATVSALGTGEIPFYRSSDATITSADTIVGLGLTHGHELFPGAQIPIEPFHTVSPSTVGTYYYGACIVVAGDSDTSNDCSAGVQVDVTDSGFDLSVTAFSVSKSSPLTGEQITLNATVTNDASATASSPRYPRRAELRYYRSSDATITSADTKVSTADSINALAAAATSNQGALYTPRTAGTFYYGACVVGVGDSDASNNCSAGVEVVIEQRMFDLSVTALSVSDAAPTAGDTFTLTATVTNAASAIHSSPVAVLNYYIGSRDAEDKRLSPLAAAASITETVSVTVPYTVGTYYYRACVVEHFFTDVFIDDDNSNNCSATVQVTVTERDYDLSITAFTVSDTSVFMGEIVGLTATVTNAASATHSSLAADLRYYSSTDATITTSDRRLGYYDINPLAAGASRTVPSRVTGLNAAVTFYIGACAVVYYRGIPTADTDPSNDCSAGVRVDVVEPDFDLSVTAFSVDPSSVVAGNPITFSATVGNASSATTSSRVATLRYYRSSDATITSADTVVGTADSISALAAATTESETATDSPSTAGTYYYGACVVGIGDSDTSNDCSAGVRVDVVEPDFDLSVTAFSVDPSSVVAGNPITFSATVGNDSSATTSSRVATLRYYRSSDATITSADTEVGTADSISALAASATESETATDSPGTAGTYYYGACVVAAGDSDTSNNCSTGVQVVVTPREFDLSVTAFSVSDSSPLTNESIRLSATVTNASSATVSSPAATLRYYRSTDATITSADTEVGTADSISALAASATESETATDSPSTAGTYYYGACIVATGDSDTSNNCSAGVQVVVATQDFDLSVTTFSIRDASAARVGSRIWFDATVGNDSSATVSSPDRSVLSFYRSSDATISSSDIAFARDSIGALAAGETDNESESEILGTAGTHYYYACIFATGDSDTSNDCSAVVQVDVAARDFDLSVTAFSVNSSSVVAGDDITLTATVRNDASALHSSPATVIALRYYRSSDSTIETTDTFLDYKSVTELAAGATETILNTLRAPAAGTYYYGACIEVTGDSDTGNDCSAGVQVVVTASSP